VIRTKSDIKFHYDGCGYNRNLDYAAVNVKIYDGWYNKSIPKEIDGQRVHPAFTRQWIENELDEETRNRWWDAAIEDGWDLLKCDAENVYGYGAKVYSQGRSGGWAIVCPPEKNRGGFNVEDVAGWNAIDLGKFRRWAKWARQTADDVWDNWIRLLYEHEFLTAQEESKERLRNAMKYTWADAR
jgi:hypothetical protein